MQISLKLDHIFVSTLKTIIKEICGTELPFTIQMHGFVFHLTLFFIATLFFIVQDKDTIHTLYFVKVRHEPLSVNNFFLCPVSYVISKENKSFPFMWITCNKSLFSHLPLCICLCSQIFISVQCSWLIGFKL